jgi:CRP-like cAMP-binding protein
MNSEQEIYEKYGREYQTGEVIFKEGDIGNEMYIIQVGKVKISKQIKDVEKVLTILGPGDFFGEMAIIDKDVRSATATVLENSKILALTTEVFELHMQTNPKIVKKILKNLTMRLREANQQIAILMIKEPNRLIASTLLLQAAKYKQNTENEVEVDMEISFQELGQLCSLDEEKTRTAIEKMVKAKVLRIQSNNQIVGINLVNLEKYIKYLEMKEQFDN